MISALFVSGVLLGASNAGEAFLSWSEKQATATAKAMRVEGRVGGWLDVRVVHTEHSYNYKLRATWMTPDVIRATARIQQLAEGLGDDATLARVEDAENRGDAVILVEIDPREGSGIIPRDWVALLRPKTADGSGEAVSGVNRPELRSVKALSGAHKRDYAYDLFWLVFPLTRSDGTPLFRDSDAEAELVVRIQGKEGRVSWRIPGSIRDRSEALASKNRSLR